MWFIVGLVVAFILLLPWITRAEEPRPWTPSEKGFLYWSILASVADMYTTCRAMDQEGVYEINPIMHRHPSDGEVVLVLGLSQIAIICITHWWPDLELPIFGKINSRKAFLGSKAGLNSYLAITNTR